MIKMNAEEIRLLFDKNKFEEITEEEYIDLKIVGEFSVDFHGGEGLLYFKPKIQYPVIFEDGFIRIIVSKAGELKIINEHSGLPTISFNRIETFKLLSDAVKLATRLRENQK